MDTTFYITFSMKTERGTDSFGRFYIGDNRDDAYLIFRKLKGSSEIAGPNVLFIDFMETVNGLPVNIKMIACTLEQLAENCRIITRELFKLYNLENAGG